MIEARYWQTLADQAVRCDLCPHRCVIRPGRPGICRARRNVDGRLIAWNYGKITSMAIDPIEKKPLAFFRSGSRILSIGSLGCNLRCDFCQNWSIAQQEATSTLIEPAEMAMMAKKAAKQGSIGLAYTYNEPLIGFEYILDCARRLHRDGLVNVLVTNGMIEQAPFAELLPWIDALNIDLKGWQPGFYKNICGGDLETVKLRIEEAAVSCHVEVTTLLIPGLNDREDDIEAMAVWLALIDRKLPWHLTRYHPAYKRAEPQPIDIGRLTMLAELAGKYLDHVLLGNI